MDWDVFICHAWEDKESFVRPLAKALEAEGLRVWFDEFTLTVGDSLRRSIDRGLANSRYGIVVLSPNFFAKEWPQKELDGLASREVSGEKVILPVWHNITADQVRKYSPTLADRVAVSSSRGLKHVVAELLRAMRPHLEEIREGAERKAREEAERLEQERREREAREEAARERQAHRADQMGRARAAIRESRWADAVNLLNQLRAEAPEYERETIESLLTQAQEAIRREQHLQKLYQQAETHIRRQEWASAVADLQQLLAINSAYRDAARQLEYVQNQVRWAELYDQGVEHQKARRWEEALSAMRRARRLWLWAVILALLLLIGAFAVWIRGSGEESPFTPLTATKTPTVTVAFTPAYAESMPAWSPDGQQVAFLKWGKGWELWIVDTHGVRTQIDTHCGAHAAPVWLLDGRFIVFGGGCSAGMAMFSVDIHTGKLKMISDELNDVYNIQMYLSEDTRHIVLYSPRWRGGGWFVADLSSGKISALEGSIRVYEQGTYPWKVSVIPPSPPQL